MANTITTKYGTKINVAGLTPEQIAKVRSTAEDKGAYGSKGAALADTFRKQSGNQGGQTGANPTGQQQLIDPATGQIKDPNAVLDQMPHIPGAGDMQGEVDKTRDATYNYLTQYNKQDKGQELEAKKQELANQGIPYSDDPNSRWQKELTGLDRKYQSLDDQAHNQAIVAGNSVFATENTAATNASDQFLKAVLGMSDIELKKFGISQDFKAKMAAIKKSGSGGGSSGGGGGGPIVGGTPPGFQI